MKRTTIRDDMRDTIVSDTREEARRCITEITDCETYWQVMGITNYDVNSIKYAVSERLNKVVSSACTGGD